MACVAALHPPVPQSPFHLHHPSEDTSPLEYPPCLCPLLTVAPICHELEATATGTCSTIEFVFQSCLWVFDAEFLFRSSGPRAGTREVHNKLEKNRRAHLKECFETLRLQLPSSTDDKKSSNLSILDSAIKYIQVCFVLSVAIRYFRMKLFYCNIFVVVKTSRKGSRT